MLMPNAVQVYDHQTEYENLEEPRSYPDYVQQFLVLKLGFHYVPGKIFLDDPKTKLSMDKSLR